MNDFYKKIGQNIEKYRKMKGLSAEELGNRVGLTKKTIRRYETGEIRIINDRVLAIADALDIDPADLYEGTDIVELADDFTKKELLFSIFEKIVIYREKGKLKKITLDYTLK